MKLCRFFSTDDTSPLPYQHLPVFEYDLKDDQETDMRLLRVIPVAGNLQLEDGGYTRLNVIMHLGPRRENSQHRKCVAQEIYFKRHVLAFLPPYRRTAFGVAWRHVRRQKPVCFTPLPMQSHR